MGRRGLKFTKAQSYGQARIHRNHRRQYPLALQPLWATTRQMATTLYTRGLNGVIPLQDLTSSRLQVINEQPADSRQQPGPGQLDGQQDDQARDQQQHPNEATPEQPQNEQQQKAETLGRRLAAYYQSLLLFLDYHRRKLSVFGSVVAILLAIIAVGMYTISTGLFRLYASQCSPSAFSSRGPWKTHADVRNSDTFQSSDFSEEVVNQLHWPTTVGTVRLSAGWGRASETWEEDL